MVIGMVLASPVADRPGTLVDTVTLGCDSKRDLVQYAEAKREEGFRLS
jgi:hypothetical protein